MFTPKNREKYVGTIPFKLLSLWERSVCEYLDECKSVTRWAYEGTEIPYVCPHDGRLRKYIPDFLVQFEDVNGKRRNFIWEVKPKKQAYLRESARKGDRMIFETNLAKFRAAQEFCKAHNMEFAVITEDDILGRKSHGG